MTNAHSPLTAEQQHRLLETYNTLSHLLETVPVPAVAASVRAALAELRVALDGQAVEFDYYRGAVTVPAA